MFGILLFDVLLNIFPAYRKEYHKRVSNVAE